MCRSGENKHLEKPRTDYRNLRLHFTGTPFKCFLLSIPETDSQYERLGIAIQTILPLAELCADVRNAGQLKRPLMHIRQVPRHESVVRVILAIALSNIAACVARIRPVRRTNPALEGVLLPDEIFLRGVRYGHVASVDAEARLLRLRAEVVVRRPGVPDK